MEYENMPHFCNFRFKNGNRFVKLLIKAGEDDPNVRYMYRDNLNRDNNYLRQVEKVKEFCASSQYHKAVCLFKWNDTPEGLDFWKEIYFILKENGLCEQ